LVQGMATAWGLEMGLEMAGGLHQEREREPETETPLEMGREMSEGLHQERERDPEMAMPWEMERERGRPTAMGWLWW